MLNFETGTLNQVQQTFREGTDRKSDDGKVRRIMCTIILLGAILADVAADISVDSRSILGRYIGSMSANMLADTPLLLGRYVG